MFGTICHGLLQQLDIYHYIWYLPVKMFDMPSLIIGGVKHKKGRRVK